MWWDACYYAVLKYSALTHLAEVRVLLQQHLQVLGLLHDVRGQVARLVLQHVHQPFGLLHLVSGGRWFGVGRGVGLMG